MGILLDSYKNAILCLLVYCFFLQLSMCHTMADFSFLDNKGIDIRGKEGAKARAVFDGEVSAIFKYNGLSNVLVRHGNYISVYCNLSSVSVAKGSKVKAREEIGVVQKDASGNAVLHFQLRKETAKLNPEVWLGR